MTSTAPERTRRRAGPLSGWRGWIGGPPDGPADLPPPAAPTSDLFRERQAVIVDRRRSKRSYQSLDLVVALSALAVAFVATHARSVPRDWTHFLALRLTVQNLIALGTFGVLWLGSFRACGLYRPRMLHDRQHEIPRVLIACTLGTIPVLLLSAVVRAPGAFGYAGVLVFWLAATPATIAVAMGTRRLHHAVQHGVPRRVIIVGTGPRAVELSRHMETDAHATYDVLGFVDTREASHQAASPRGTLGCLEDFERTLMHNVVDEVFIALPIKSHYAEIEKVIRACETAGIQSKHLADVFTPSLARPRIETCGDLPVMAMRVVEDDYRLKVKRAFDIACVACVLPLVLPVLACIAVLIKATSPGPILFAQIRCGYKKRRFRMLKFRTMQENAESMMDLLEEHNEATGPVFKIKNDPRVTSIGRFLRKSSLDELPQLFNVLRGDMSLVGPRPLSARDVGRFEYAATMRRFSVRPGLTGLWQISGRSNLPFKQWVQLDLAYIDGWSLLLDLKILVKTIPAVIRGTGAA